ncbi:hypothetical protein OAK70_02470 [Akkermansiaceae bacterium]|nr:hypothetical protein [Akkermansiaceae bacterium]
MNREFLTSFRKGIEVFFRTNYVEFKLNSSSIVTSSFFQETLCLNFYIQRFFAHGITLPTSAADAQGKMGGEGGGVRREC